MGRGFVAQVEISLVGDDQFDGEGDHHIQPSCVEDDLHEHLE